MNHNIVWDFSEHERLQAQGEIQYLKEIQSKILNALTDLPYKDAYTALGEIAQMCNMAREALRIEGGEK